MARGCLVKPQEKATEAIVSLRLKTRETLMTNNKMLGKWKVIRSEIPNYSICEEVLDFGPNGVLIWSLDGHTLRYFYKVEESKLIYKVNKNDFVIVNIVNDSPFLILEPSHKHRSWIARVAPMKDDAEGVKVNRTSQ
jgi:hypothetical protein